MAICITSTRSWLAPFSCPEHTQRTIFKIIGTWCGSNLTCSADHWEQRHAAQQGAPPDILRRRVSFVVILHWKHHVDFEIHNDRSRFAWSQAVWIDCRTGNVRDVWSVVGESIRRRPKEGRDLYELNNLGFIRICWRKKSGPYEGEISIHLS